MLYNVVLGIFHKFETYSTGSAINKLNDVSFLTLFILFHVTGSKKREKEANRSSEIMSEGKKLGHNNIMKNY